MSTALTSWSRADELSQDEATKVFESAAKKWFGVSGRAFVRIYDGGMCGRFDRDTAKAQFVDSLRRLARQ